MDNQKTNKWIESKDPMKSVRFVISQYPVNTKYYELTAIYWICRIEIFLFPPSLKLFRDWVTGNIVDSNKFGPRITPDDPYYWIDRVESFETYSNMIARNINKVRCSEALAAE